MKDGESVMPPKRPIRVLYIDHCSELSGAEIALLHLIRGFSGVEPMVLLSGLGPFARALQDAGIPVYVEPLDDSVRSYRRSLGSPRSPGRSMPTVLASLAAYSWVVARRIQAVMPDVVHTNSAKAHIYGGIAARIARLPVIWHLREPVAVESLGIFSSLAMRVCSQVIPTAVVANSARTARSVRRLRRPVSVVPSPIELRRFAGVSDGQARSDGVRVGIIATLAPQKGQDVFLKGFAEAFASVPDVSAVVCGGNLFGDEDYERGLRDLAVKLGIADRVSFTGFVPDVERVLSTLDVLVSASVRSEGLGQTILQALAAGVPVVATTKAGACDFLTHRDSALLVRPANPQELAAAMRDLLTDSELRSRLRRRGRTLAERFAPEVVQGQMLQTYEEVLAAWRGLRSVSPYPENCRANA